MHFVDIAAPCLHLSVSETTVKDGLVFNFSYTTGVSCKTFNNSKTMFKKIDVCSKLVYRLWIGQNFTKKYHYEKTFTVRLT